jgi:undecaprenyl-diphosphatase
MDYQIVLYLNKLGYGTFIDNITNFVSWIPFIFVLWLVLGVYSIIKDKKNGKWVFITILVALGLHFIISEGLFKHFLADFLHIFRFRPWFAHPIEIRSIGKQFMDSSFPSSHMASTLAALTVFVYYYRKTWPWALLFVLFMAFSRMHNGMHYPTDVLAGSLLGILYGLLAIKIVRKIIIKEKNVKKNND